MRSCWSMVGSVECIVAVVKVYKRDVEMWVRYMGMDGMGLVHQGERQKILEE